MSKEDGNLNWVMRRALRDRMLSTGAFIVWEGVRAALQDACETYNEHYPADANRKEVRCEFENGKRLKITRTLFVNRLDRSVDVKTMLVSFDDDAPLIQAVAASGSPVKFRIQANETSAYPIHEEKPISAEELSRLILEPLFFPSDERRHPVFIEPYREVSSGGGHAPDSWMS